MSHVRLAVRLSLAAMLLFPAALRAAGSIFDEESWEDESTEPAKPGTRKPPPAPFKIEPPEPEEVAPPAPDEPAAPVEPDAPAPPPAPRPKVRLKPQDVVRINTLKIKAAGPQPAKLIDPAVITLYHEKAIAHAQLGEMPAARAAMDKVLAATLGNRSVVLNAARLDVAGRRDAMRAATVLEKHCKARPGEPDEEAVELWGMALATYARDRGRVPDAKVTAFEAAQKALEATRPGFHRWGNRWLSGEEHREIERERAEVMEEVRRERDQVRDAQNRYNNLEARSRIRSRSGRVVRLDPVIVQQMALVDVEIRREKKELATTLRKVPRPKWVIPLKMQDADANLKPE